MFTFRLLLPRPVLVAFLFTTTAFADSIGLWNVETFAIPFGDDMTSVSINDNGDIAGTFVSSLPDEVDL